MWLIQAPIHVATYQRRLRHVVGYRARTGCVVRALTRLAAGINEGGVQMTAKLR